MSKFAVKSTALLLALGFAGTAMSAESLQDVMKRRNLSQQDLLAAAKTYVPTGKRDEFIAFSSGGQSGQVLVYGIPSMRILTDIHQLMMLQEQQCRRIRIIIEITRHNNLRIIIK